MVAGCLPLRYKEDLKDSLPEVSLFVTPDRIADLPRLLGQGPPAVVSVPSAPDSNRTLTTPGYAYLKIAEGCVRKCAYCTIPSIRGPLTSPRMPPGWSKKLRVWQREASASLCS